MRETDFYQRHIKKMSGVLHLERIENAVGVGFPDVSAAGGGKQFLIETKVSKEAEGHDCLYFERFQLPFYQKRLRYTDDKGIYIAAMCAGETEIYFWTARQILGAPREPYKKWMRVRVSDISEPFASWQKPWRTHAMEDIARLLIKLS